jgi:hypothetical protein
MQTQCSATLVANRDRLLLSFRRADGTNNAAGVVEDANRRLILTLGTICNLKVTATRQLDAPGIPE